MLSRRSPGARLAMLCLVSVLPCLQGSAAVAELRCLEGAAPSADARWSEIRNLNATYSLPPYADLGQWQARRAWLRDQARVSCGLWPMPQPAPVAAEVFGRVERDGYTVEKVLFASRPGLYVTGNLYRPLGTPGPHPAVLCPHGHWTRGRIEHSEECSAPGRAIGLARRGIVAFSYDMVGFLDSDRLPHAWDDPRLALWGVSAAGLQTLNSVRAVDFLCSLPDVDPTRIGVTGASGGGTQTFLLAAVDPRIAAAAPVNMVSAHFQGGCICENPPSLRVGTFNPELISIMAPKPVLLISCTGDWSADTPTVEGPMVRSIYSLYGEPEGVRWAREEAGHNYNRASRQHAYRFFHEAFFGTPDPAGGEEAPFEPEPDEALRLWTDRQPPADTADLAGLTESLVAGKRRLVEGLLAPSPDERRETARSLRPAYDHALQVERPAPERLVVRECGRQGAPTWTARCHTIGRAGVGDAIPAVWFEPSDAPATGAVLLVSDQGKRTFLDGDGSGPGALARALLREGRAVLAIDPFGVGEAEAPAGRAERAAGTEYFTTYNRVDAAERVQDILTASAYLGGSRAERQEIGVVGLGAGGLWTTLALPYLPREWSAAADLAGFDRGDDGAFLRALPIPLLRQAGDLATALAEAGPERVMLWNAAPTMETATRARWPLRAGRPSGEELAEWFR